MKFSIENHFDFIDSDSVQNIDFTENEINFVVGNNNSGKTQLLNLLHSQKEDTDKNDLINIKFAHKLNDLGSKDKFWEISSKLSIFNNSTEKLNLENSSVDIYIDSVNVKQTNFGENVSDGIDKMSYFILLENMINKYIESEIRIQFNSINFDKRIIDIYKNYKINFYDEIDYEILQNNPLYFDEIKNETLKINDLKNSDDTFRKYLLEINSTNIINGMKKLKENISLYEHFVDMIDIYNDLENEDFFSDVSDDKLSFEEKRYKAKVEKEKFYFDSLISLMDSEKQQISFDEICTLNLFRKVNDLYEIFVNGNYIIDSVTLCQLKMFSFANITIFNNDNALLLSIDKYFKIENNDIFWNGVNKKEIFDELNEKIRKKIVVLIDEPENSLDWSNIIYFSSVIERINKSIKPISTTFIISTHSPKLLSISKNLNSKIIYPWFCKEKKLKKYSEFIFKLENGNFVIKGIANYEVFFSRNVVFVEGVTDFFIFNEIRSNLKSEHNLFYKSSALAYMDGTKSIEETFNFIKINENAFDKVVFITDNDNLVNGHKFEFSEERKSDYKGYYVDAWKVGMDISDDEDINSKIKNSFYYKYISSEAKFEKLVKNKILFLSHGFYGVEHFMFNMMKMLQHDTLKEFDSFLDYTQKMVKENKKEDFIKMNGLLEFIIENADMLMDEISILINSDADLDYIREKFNANIHNLKFPFYDEIKNDFGKFSKQIMTGRKSHLECFMIEIKLNEIVNEEVVVKKLKIGPFKSNPFILK